MSSHLHLRHDPRRRLKIRQKDLGCMNNRKSEWAGDEERRWREKGNASPLDSDLVTGRVWRQQGFGRNGSGR